MPLYRTILATTDFSNVSDSAVYRGAELATLLGAQLHLLHVIEHFPEDRPSGEPFPENEDPVDFYRRRARERMIEQIQRLNITEPEMHILLSRYSAARSIIEFINSHNTELVVLGNEPKFFSLGSTATSVAHRAECDVLVVRNS
ncbi:universal stress protein [Thiohalomonas denitrificans]|uniref:universal stress protein n=1 Tax=Thiohalomonas denitrificans TaxID=415747 RepID=UPI0026EA4A44|nr:universal stress protein [Thiohalomonas denitrificans]